MKLVFYMFKVISSLIADCQGWLLSYSFLMKRKDVLVALKYEQ